MNKRFSIFLIFLVSGLILIGLSKQIADALEASSRLDKAVSEVGLIQQRNKELKNDLTNAQKYEFVEEAARDKLNLAKPNETVVIIPEAEINKIIEAAKPKITPKIPNWQGWMRLFLM